MSKEYSQLYRDYLNYQGEVVGEDYGYDSDFIAFDPYRPTANPVAIKKYRHINPEPVVIYANLHNKMADLISSTNMVHVIAGENMNICIQPIDEVVYGGEQVASVSALVPGPHFLGLVYGDRSHVDAPSWINDQWLSHIRTETGKKDLQDSCQSLTWKLRSLMLCCESSPEDTLTKRQLEYFIKHNLEWIDIEPLNLKPSTLSENTVVITDTGASFSREIRHLELIR